MTRRLGRRRWLTGAAAVLAYASTTAARAETTALDVQPAVRIELALGDVDVEIDTTDTNRVRLVETSLPHGFRAELRGTAERVEVVVHGVGVPSSGRIALRVPRGAHLEIRARSGDVTVHGLDGEAHVSVLHGHIALDGAPTRVEASTTSGDVRVSGVREDAALATVNGDIVVTDARGRLDANTVSGALRVHGTGLTRTSMATVAGSLELRGQLEAGTHSIDAHSGNIAVHLPRARGLHVRARTFSGVIEDAWTDPPTRVRSRYDVTRGDGAVRLRIGTFNSNIRLSPTRG